MNNKQKMIATRTIGLLVMVCAASTLLAASVKVKVREVAGTNSTSYFYRVENGTSEPMVALKIGFDRATGQPQLLTMPLGWTLENGLPSSSAVAPAGWTARVILTEETNPFEVEWSSDGDPLRDIAPGATASGFSVKVAQPAAEYRTSTFDVILGNGTHVSGLLEPEELPSSDTSAPSLSVRLTPTLLWPPDRKMVAVTAVITVSDDRDANPQIRLVSIVANEPLAAGDVDGAMLGSDDRQFSLRAERSGQLVEGRVYTVTYSATDAAGNTTTATATVIVPHDQRR